MVEELICYVALCFPNFSGRELEDIHGSQNVSLRGSQQRKPRHFGVLASIVSKIFIPEHALSNRR